MGRCGPIGELFRRWGPRGRLKGPWSMDRGLDEQEQHVVGTHERVAFGSKREGNSDTQGSTDGMSRPLWHHVK